MLHPLPFSLPVPEAAPAYHYTGRCPRTGLALRLPRTAEAEAVARALMAELETIGPAVAEGKMYGVLLVATAAGERRVLRAFSGLWQGQRQQPGWVPPIPGWGQVRLQETQTLQQLDQWRRRLEVLEALPVRSQLAQQQQQYDQQLGALKQCHRERKGQRHQQRQQLPQTLAGPALAAALGELERQSQQDGLERRRLKRQRDQALAPLQQAVAVADAEVQALKQQRRQLSRQLQAQMHAAYTVSNFAGESVSIAQLTAAGALPTGTGDCCAPKLLHYAATHQLQPLALAEFWWGPPPPGGGKQAGQFYGACRERCQPMMGFLLSGATDLSAALPQAAAPAATIIYQDDWLLAVNKPPGLLSVPGRSLDRQDCVLHQLQRQFPDRPELRAIHRLDQATSGVLLVTCDRSTHGHLSRQFQQRQIHKVYEALLVGTLDRDAGEVTLPLWSNPRRRPRQEVNWHQGKSSCTQFRVLARQGNNTRIEFIPLTGRTHQLRVHASHPQGLGCPILGDHLYGQAFPHPRLCLHGRQLGFTHPQTGEWLELQVPTPF